MIRPGNPVSLLFGTIFHLFSEINILNFALTVHCVTFGGIALANNYGNPNFNLSLNLRGILNLKHPV